MNTSISPAIKIAILVVLAILFATTLIGLSLQGPGGRGDDYGRRFDQQTRKFTETFEARSGGTLRLDTDVGDVSVTGGDVSAVEVVVDVKGDEADVDDFAVRFNKTDQGVEVRGRYREGNGWDFEWRDFDVRYTIVVPAEYNLKLETSGGDIVITAVNGVIRGGTSGGDMDLTAIRGDVNLETSGGDIRLKEITGTVITETSGGDIDGAGLSGDVRVETSGGDIDLREVNGKTYASTSGGDVRVTLIENKGVDASSSGGNITITFSGDIAADVYAEASAGNVRCDYPFQGTLEDGNLQGTISGGGQKVRAETSGGDISIRRKN